MRTANELKQVEFGQNGGMIIADTDEYTGDWRRMIVLADAAFTTLTSNFTKNGTTPAVGSDFGTVTAGTIISGKFTKVKLSGGSVVMLN